MNKVQLEARLEGLTDEINFLRHLYEEVREDLGALYYICHQLLNLTPLYNVFSFYYDIVYTLSL